jgi:hypothetical protein
LKIHVSIFQDGVTKSNLGNTLVYSTQFPGTAGAKQDINIDILEIAKSQLLPSSSITILLKAEERSIKIETAKILLSATRR